MSTTTFNCRTFPSSFSTFSLSSSSSTFPNLLNSTFSLPKFLFFTFLLISSFANMETEAAYPKLKPALTAYLDIEPGLPVGPLSHGPNLVYVKIRSGTLKSHPSYKVKVDAELIAGADWIHGDPSGDIQRLDVRSLFKTDDGAILNFSYLGIITMDSDIASIFGETAKAGLVTDWKAITHKFIQTGDEKYKHLENAVLVAAGRFHVKEDKVVVEYKISEVVGV